jgi:ABC-2 type transport system permease protein
VWPLLQRSIINNLKTLSANPGETTLGVVAMIANNTLYFGSVTLLLFGSDTKSQGLKHYLIMQAIVFASWGAIHVFAGGLRVLGEIIESGEMDTYLGLPQHPLLLSGMSRSDLGAFGDLVMGLGMIFGFAFLYGPWIAFGSFVASLIAISGVFSLFVLGASLALFFERSKSVQELFIQTSLVCVGWPISPKLQGMERIFVYITPLAAISFLNVEAVLEATPTAWLISILFAALFFALALIMFRFGIKRYQGVSAIGVR